MLFLTEVPVVDSSLTETITLLTVLLGGGALTFDRFRTRNSNKNNPGSREELEAIKKSVTEEGDKTREAVHRRATEARTEKEQQTRDIVEAIKESKGDIVSAVKDGDKSIVDAIRSLKGSD